MMGFGGGEECWNRFLEIIFIMRGILRLSSNNEVDFRGKGF